MSEFHFHTKFDQTILLGKRARNVAELLAHIRTVPDASIYYHTHRYLEQHHYLSPEPPNDFAYWVTNVLNEDLLAEMMLSIDIIQFQTIGELRNAFTQLLDSYLQKAKKLANCPEGEEFHFMASRTFVLPTAQVATTPGEFINALQRVTVSTLYYHIFDAKLRLAKGENDFSAWFGDMGLHDLAEELRRLDPYTYTLEGLRKRIIVLVRKYDQHKGL